MSLFSTSNSLLWDGAGKLSEKFEYQINDSDIKLILLFFIDNLAFIGEVKQKQSSRVWFVSSRQTIGIEKFTDRFYIYQPFS